MQKKTTITSLAAALILGAAMSANAQTAATTTVGTAPSGSAQQANNFAETRTVLAKSNLCDWYRNGGMTWDYAGQQTLTDWTAATQAVTGDLRKVDSTLTGDALERAAEQQITELCAKQPTHTAGAI